MEAPTQNVADILIYLERWAEDAERITGAIHACVPGNRLPLIEAAYEHLCAGPPAFAADHDAMDWARRWAEIASLRECKAYALACFEALPAHEQTAFLTYVNRREAA